MSAVCESWSLDDLVQMTEHDMEALLAHYKSGETPSLQHLRS